jgi:hypothetical protein
MSSPVGDDAPRFMASRRTTRSRRVVAAVVVGGLAVVLAVSGCGGSGDDPEVASPGTDASNQALCDAMGEAQRVWDTQAPESVLGDPDVLADFAGALQRSFNDAMTVVAGQAPPEVDADIATVRTSLADLYATAIRYVAGDMEAVPVQSPEALEALGRVKDWARPQCPGVTW